MTKIKSYTNLEQSKKLAEILPLESADMWYQPKDKQGDDYMPFPHINKVYANELPCWSLSALLGVLKERDDCNVLEMFTNKAQLYTITTSYYKDASWKNTPITSDNPVDACYEMIIRLHELKMQ